MESLAREVTAEPRELLLRRGKIPYKRQARLRCPLDSYYYGAYVLHPRSPESHLRSRDANLQRRQASCSRCSRAVGCAVVRSVALRELAPNCFIGREG